MKELASEYPLQELAWAFEVSRSGFYRWLKRTEGERARKARELTVHLQRIHQEKKQRYGSPRMCQQLRKEGIHTSENRVARLMKAAGIKARPKRAFRPRTTDSNHPDPIAPNQLKAIQGPTGADQIWVTDITYIWTLQGWIYLAAVMDLFSRRIVGWALSDTLETTLVKEALARAQKERRPPPGLLHHSDRGCQYASHAYRALLESWGMNASMSAAGCCYDNAAMESFWSTLKTELVPETCFADLREARTALFEYIELFYNPKRLHSALGYQSPVDFENQNNYKQN